MEFRNSIMSVITALYDKMSENRTTKFQLTINDKNKMIVKLKTSLRKY